jgi:hypothetical protein
MKIGSFQVIAPHKHLHFKPLTDISAKIFPDYGYFGMYRYIADYYLGNSHYDWDVSRIGCADNQIVTHWGVWNYAMRIGTARVKTAGIGAVLTHPDYRRKGLLLKTALPSLAAARKAGYDISILFGIPGFYHKLHYTRAWIQSSYIVAVHDLPKEKPDRTFRKLSNNNFKEITALYNRKSASLTGSAVRPTYQSLRKKETGYYWCNDAGNIIGYVRCDTSPGSLTCCEAVGDPEQVLRVLAALARKNTVREIRFQSLHYENPVTVRLRAGTCRQELRSHANGGPMIRIISLASTLEKLCGELSRQLKHSHLSGWSGDLLITSDEEKILLKITNGSVRVTAGKSSRNAIRAGKELAQLLIGTDDPLAVVHQYNMRLSGAARRLVPVLFPARHPMLGARDSF